MLPRHDLVVLAGGTGQRMGGADKAEVVIAGRRLIDRVLLAAPGAGQFVVVGPVRRTVHPVRWCREDPPGGGPVPAVAAALTLVDAPYVIVLAVDLPMVDEAVVAELLVAATGRDGAIGVDSAGREQPILAAYDTSVLRAAVNALDPLAGASMRSLIAGLELVRVDVGLAALDCDTWADVATAERVERPHEDRPVSTRGTA